MYALDATVPFTRTDTIVYNGYLLFATINQDNTATILDSNTEIAKDELYDTSRNGLTLATESMKAEKIQRESGLAEATYARSSEVLVSGGSDTSLVYSAGNNSSPGRLTAESMRLLCICDTWTIILIIIMCSTHITQNKS